MSISKNGLMTFQMSKIHLSTYYRMRKVLGLSNEGFMLI